jgi:ferredoxin
MPTIEFLPSRIGPGVRVEDAHGPLIDVCDEVQAPLEFGCRSASCGTCRVIVLTGGELLELPEDDEVEVLDVFGAELDERLACQAKIRPGPGLIQLRWIEDE